MGMQGQHDDLEVLIRRFVVHYLMNFRRPLEDHLANEIKGTVDRVLRQLDSMSRRDILLGEDRAIMESLKSAFDSGKPSAVHDKLRDLGQLLGDKNHRAMSLPMGPKKSYGLLSFGAATAVSLMFVLTFAVMGHG